MRIRPFAPSDRAKAIDLAVAAFRTNSLGAALVQQFGPLAELEPAEMIREGVDEALDRNGDGALVAELEGEVVGFVITQCFARRKVGWVPILAVAESHQRKGIGRALMDSAIARLRERGMKYARTETLDTNEGSRRLFPQLGFEEFAREIQYFMKLSDG